MNILFSKPSGLWLQQYDLWKALVKSNFFLKHQGSSPLHLKLQLTCLCLQFSIFVISVFTVSHLKPHLFLTNQFQTNNNQPVTGQPVTGSLQDGSNAGESGYHCSFQSISGNCLSHPVFQVSAQLLH